MTSSIDTLPTSGHNVGPYPLFCPEKVLSAEFPRHLSTGGGVITLDDRSRPQTPDHVASPAGMPILNAALGWQNPRPLLLKQTQPTFGAFRPACLVQGGKFQGYKNKIAKTTYLYVEF